MMLSIGTSGHPYDRLDYSVISAHIISTHVYCGGLLCLLISTLTIEYNKSIHIHCVILLCPILSRGVYIGNVLKQTLNAQSCSLSTLSYLIFSLTYLGIVTLCQYTAVLGITTVLVFYTPNVISKKRHCLSNGD